MTTTFNDNGVQSVKWRDCMNKEFTCTQESYNKIYKNAEKEIKFGRDHDLEKRVDEIANSNEDLILQKEEQLRKLQDEDRSALMRMSNQDLLDEIERLKKEKDDLESDIKSSKSASTQELIGVDNFESKIYSVLKLNTRTYHNDGEQLIIELGSK